MVSTLIAVLLFAMISSKLKMNAPYCHTYVFALSDTGVCR